MRRSTFATALVLCAALAACATTDDRTSAAPPHAQGSVAGERVDAPDAERYRIAPGERYEQPFAHADNAAPDYPASLLPLALPPRVVTAKLVINAEGRVADVMPIDLAASPENDAMFASVRNAVQQWLFFPLVRIVTGADKTTVRIAEMSVTYDGKAETLPFSQVYKFTFTQSAGVGSVGVGGR